MSTPAEDAYRAAEEEIARVKAEGGELLDLDRAEFRALETLPLSISELGSVRRLSLRNTRISDITPIAHMKGVTSLDLGGTPITDIAPIAHVKGITSLNLRNTPITDITPLAKMTGITTLDLSNTKITDIAPIAKMTGITSLGLGGTQITDITPLKALSSIIDLDLSGITIAQTETLKALPKIEDLNLIDCKIESFRSLEGMANLKVLRASGTPISDVTPLREMSSLERLWLELTPVDDISALRNLHQLQELLLYRTKVTDLQPVLGLRRLATEPANTGLRFSETPAARHDHQIAEIAQIRDNSERARALFDYLEDWVPPGEAPPEDTLVSVSVAHEQIDVDAVTPSQAEIDERLRQILYEQLREKTGELCRAAGNRYPKLAARARMLEDLLRNAFADVDILRLHLAVEDLRLLADQGQEEGGDPFPSEVVVPLTEVVDRGPGLTLDNAEVEVLLARANRRRAAGPEPEDIQDAHDRMSEATAKDEAAIGERLRKLENQIIGGATAEAQETQRAAHKNIIIRLGRIAWAGCKFAAGVTVTIAATEAFGPAIAAYVKTNLPLLAEVAATHGPAVAKFFAEAMAKISDLSGILASIEGPTRDKLWRSDQKD